MHETVLSDRVQIAVGSWTNRSVHASMTMSGRNINPLGFRSMISCRAFPGTALRWLPRRMTARARPKPPRDAGVVDQHIDVAQPGGRFPDGGPLNATSTLKNTRRAADPCCLGQGCARMSLRWGIEALHHTSAIPKCALGPVLHGRHDEAVRRLPSGARHFQDVEANSCARLVESRKQLGLLSTLSCR
jgi:hypothetical protein